jgi:hypothetical protein
MTPKELQDKLDKLDEYTKELENRIQVLENPTKKAVQTPLINQVNELRVDILYLKYVSTTTALEPTLKPNQVMLWNNATTSKYYLKANFNGTAKKVELI